MTMTKNKIWRRTLNLSISYVIKKEEANYPKLLQTSRLTYSMSYRSHSTGTSPSQKIQNHKETAQSNDSDTNTHTIHTQKPDQQN